MVGRSQRSSITFALALATLADPHWSALAPSAPLRRFRLIDMEGEQGLTAAPLRIEERVLHYLAGVNQLDARLEGFLQSRPQPVWIAEEHRALAERTPGVATRTRCAAFPGASPVGRRSARAGGHRRPAGPAQQSPALYSAPRQSSEYGRRGGSVHPVVDARSAAAARTAAAAMGICRGDECGATIDGEAACAPLSLRAATRSVCTVASQAMR